MDPRIERLQAIARELREMFPGEKLLQLSVSGDSLEVAYFGNNTYHEATAWFRSWGVGVRTKQPHDTYTCLRGKLDNLTLTTYPDELPPTCRKVKKIERIPKTKSVQTGEFIEIEREVIECGPEVTEAAS